MKQPFSLEQLERRIRFENPWWGSGKKIDSYYREMKKRAYFKSFQQLVRERSIKRAVVLMGPRRVGKTVLIYHSIQDLIDGGIDPKNICYLSLETPIYTGLGLEYLLNFFLDTTGRRHTEELYVYFDEIQYLKDWEVHLKSLVDSYHYIKFVVSGSAAAALKLKSQESGAGRFTDFVLPPLTFYEYLSFVDSEQIIEEDLTRELTSYHDLESLNNHFIDYINYGGYPEVSLSETIRQDPQRYIRNDIIDKVLLRDLPSVYGIQDVQELNSLFNYLAWNSGQETSLDSLSQHSGVAKNTVLKYLGYLEAAFLILITKRISNNARKFERANFFKVYLTNPALRSALFSPLKKDDTAMGHMVETAIFAHFYHHPDVLRRLYYARWPGGEVDMVQLDDKTQKPVSATEIKWSNRFIEDPTLLQKTRRFCQNNGLDNCLVTTIDKNQEIKEEGFTFHFVPASVFCWYIGKNVLDQKNLDIERLLREGR